ncbi:MAG TPA: hypothetical protein VGT78_02265 [Rhizomicrobium sp.]|nr:hypothetical protein [Rhizomicrobium sp.]
MTADLLARKGDAMPSTILPAKQPVMWARHDTQPPQQTAQPASISRPVAEQRFLYAQTKSPEPATDVRQPAPHDHDKPRRLFVALSHGEHERLAIAAAKKDMTQHQIVHHALEAYFEKLALETGCRCIAGGTCTNGCSTD